MVEVMDGLNSMPWISLGRLANSWMAEVTPIPRRSKFKYGYDLWSNGLSFEAFAIGRTYKASIRAPGHGDGMWLLNFDTQGRVVNASYTGTHWGDFQTEPPEPSMGFRLLPYPSRYRPEIHRLIGGTWLRAKWIDQFDHSRLTYRAEIVGNEDSLYLAAMRTLDEFVTVCLNGGATDYGEEGGRMLQTLRSLPIKTHTELMAEADRFRGILEIQGNIPVEAPELAFDHYHAVPVKVQNGCGGPCTFCSLYDRHIHVLPQNKVYRQIDQMAEYLGEELDHFNKVVLLEGDALTVPPAQLVDSLVYARERFEFSAGAFAHAFAKASTVAKISQRDLTDLYNAGLLNVNFGLESGCQDLLDRVKKGQNLSVFRDAVCKLRDAGIEISVNIIGGLGGGKFRDQHLEETIAFVKSLPRGVPSFYSRLEVSDSTYYARKQQAEFGILADEEMALQLATFERELAATEYLFVPM